MSQSPQLELQKTPSLSATAKLGWASLISVTLFVCYFSHLGAIGFVGPDEPRYAWIARAMAETGDWVTPRLYGKPWFEKPPLFYWGAALSFKLFGVSEAAARLPSAICALLATLAMGWLAWRMYGGATARWLLLLLPTTVGMIGFSHAAATDMPFSAMLTIAMVCAAVVLGVMRNKEECAKAAGRMAHSQTPSLALLLFGLFLGLAVLAKGPAAIILCGGGVFFWALFTKRWRDAFRLLHPAAIAAFCIIALPWYILCARRNPDFLRIFIVEHNFKRYLTPEFQHIQPFWFYGPVLLAALFPWTFPFLWDAVRGALNFWRTREMSVSGWFLVNWSAFTVLFFTVSRSKLPGYVLPAVPPLGLLTARNIKGWIGDPANARWLTSTAGVPLILLALGIARARIPFVTDAYPPNAVNLWQLTAMLGGILAALLALFRRPRVSLLVVVLTVVALIVPDAGNFWSLDQGLSARPAASAALANFAKEQMSEAKVFRLRRAYKYQIDFYLKRETEEWSPETKQHSIIFTDYNNARELVRLGGECPSYVAVPAVLACKY